MESRSQTKKSALVLLSGGLDSATCLALAEEQGFRVNAISFNYGQRHSVELAAARNLAVHYKVDRHTVVAVPSLRELGGSALTSTDAVPKHDDVKELGEGIPSTYVPARNLVFLSLATATAEVAGISDIFIGVNAVDYSGYPDCRSEFIEAFASAATLGTKRGTFGETSLKLHTPLIQLSKAEIIRLGQRLGVPYELTHSCYDPHESLACGHCDSCLLRLKGFAEAGTSDPIPYSVSSAAS